MSSISAPDYEVRCHACGVSFPVGTRRCMHCGGPTAAAHAPPAQREEEDPTAWIGEATGAPPPAEPEDEELMRGNRISRGMGLVWIALAVAISLYRACTGSG